jgi:5-methylcytosine-specific restriction endonuclease McrA
VTSPADAGIGVVRFAEKCMALLEEGRFVATYKFAVLLALMDLCLEGSLESGAAPESVTTEQLAEKIVELYWPQTSDYHARNEVLRQNAGSQAEIVKHIAAFRNRLTSDASSTLHRARSADPIRFANLVRFVEWKLIEMPLPRLQIAGPVADRFIYEISWGEQVRRLEVDGSFDNQIRFKPGVGEYLLQLNTLLRPLIQRKWTLMVAHFNRLPETQLEDFLFGQDRIALARIRKHIWDMQDGRCFYCGRGISTERGVELDHFLPWSRYPDNGIENLVAADRRCNAAKRDFLAAAEHVERWAPRLGPVGAQGEQLRTIAESVNWARDPQRTCGAARALYLRLSADARLWRTESEFVPADLERLRIALARCRELERAPDPPVLRKAPAENVRTEPTPSQSG